MSKKKKSDVEVFVHKKKDIAIVCPHCKLEKVIDSGSIRDICHWGVAATCKRCMNSFTISFNFRKYYRKSTSIHGVLFESSTAQDPLIDVVINDISMSGIGFRTELNTLAKDSVLTIRFLLDDEAKTEIEKEIIIESIRNGKVGASFVETKMFDSVLNKYILSK